MEAGSKVRLRDVGVAVRDPRQAEKLEHDLTEMLGIAVYAVPSSADTHIKIQTWAKEELDWLRMYLTGHGTVGQDRFGRAFAAMHPDEFAAAFLRWLGQVVPLLVKK